MAGAKPPVYASTELTLSTVESAGPVDAAFADRFSAALLLSVIGGTTDSRGGAEQISDAMASHSGGAPALTVPQGMPVQIRVAHDLEFRQSN